MVKIKKQKITIDDVFEAVNNGFTNMESRMATKEDLNHVETGIRKEMATKEDLRALETRLTNKIDRVQESVDDLDAIDVKNLQERMMKTEKEVRVLNRHVFKTA